VTSVDDVVMTSTGGSVGGKWFGPAPLMGQGGIGWMGHEHAGRAPHVSWYCGNTTIPLALIFGRGGCNDMIAGRTINGPGSNGWQLMEYGGGLWGGGPTYVNIDFNTSGWV